MSIGFQAIKQSIYKIGIRFACCDTLKDVLSYDDNTIFLGGSLKEPHLEMKIDSFGGLHVDAWEQIYFCPFCGEQLECLFVPTLGTKIMDYEEQKNRTNKESSFSLDFEGNIIDEPTTNTNTSEPS